MAVMHTQKMHRFSPLSSNRRSHTGETSDKDQQSIDDRSPQHSRRIRKGSIRKQTNGGPVRGSDSGPEEQTGSDGEQRQLRNCFAKLQDFDMKSADSVSLKGSMKRPGTDDSGQESSENGHLHCKSTPKGLENTESNKSPVRDVETGCEKKEELEKRQNGRVKVRLDESWVEPISGQETDQSESDASLSERPVNGCSKKNKKQKQKASEESEPDSPPSKKKKNPAKGRTRQGPFQCDECGVTRSCRTFLERHMLRHTGERPFKCEECGKHYSSRSNLRIHQLSHSGEMDYACSECGQKFTHLPYLKRHLLLHSGKRQHKCKVCGKMFHQKFHLSRHMRIHTGETPYICNECGETFNRSDYLNLHNRNVHQGAVKPKTYQCEDCHKLFADSNRLEVHRRKHTQETPHPCGECGRSFAQRSQLVLHLRTHTGEIKYTCNICQKTLTRKAYLKAHTERVHQCWPQTSA